MAKLDKYLSLKKRVDKSQQEADQAEGGIQEVTNQIKREFGCDTLNAAKRKLKQLEKQETTSKKAFDDAVEKFEKDWPDE